MSGLDMNTGSVVAESAMGQGVGVAPGLKKGRAVQIYSGRFASAATVGVLTLLIGAGTAIAGPRADHVISGVANVRALQLAAVSRKDGRITVENEPLIRVIDELNRGAEQKVKVLDRSDPRYRKLRVTGQFTIGRPQVIITYMRAAGIKVQVRRDKKGNFLLRLGSDS